MAGREIFSKKRMERCGQIAKAIMDNWSKTNSFSYTVRATDTVHGITLDELRKRYFTVGVGDNLSDLPFTDMLVIFSMIESQVAALKRMGKPPEPGSQIKFKVTTDWPDAEAVRLLSGIRIETPFDEEKFLRIVEVRNAHDDEEN